MNDSSESEEARIARSAQRMIWRERLGDLDASERDLVSESIRRVARSHDLLHRTTPAQARKASP